MFDQIKGPRYSAGQSYVMLGLGLFYLVGEITRWFLRGRFDPWFLAFSLIWSAGGLYRMRRIRSDAEYDKRMAEALAPDKV